MRSKSFEYPKRQHKRRHAPPRFKDYRTYKDYLRDEFVFRCVYCLVREKWLGSDHFFSVEHFVPQSADETLRSNYDNLLYACMDCNRAKGSRLLPPEIQPELNPYGLHLFMRPNGWIEAITPEGFFLVEQLNLNERLRVDFRRMHYDLLSDALLRSGHSIARDRLKDFFGFPLDMPTFESCEGAFNPYISRPDLPDWY